MAGRRKKACAPLLPRPLRTRAQRLAKHAPTPIEFVGMRGVFAESGPPAKLLEKYGMGVKDIIAVAKRVMRRKR